MSCGPSAIAEVLVITDTCLSHDAQPSFISISQVAAVSLTAEDWTKCAHTHTHTHTHTVTHTQTETHVKVKTVYLPVSLRSQVKSLSKSQEILLYYYYNHFMAIWILSGTTRVCRYQKSKTNLDLMEQEIVSGSGISWAICKSAPHSRQKTTPASHHSVFYRPDALPAAQPTASKH